MATYYVDFVNGLDANNGLGPDASHASNKPWKTIAKLLGAAGMSSGDTAYLAPGSFRETVTVAMTSAVAETQILGDPENTRGFKTSGGVTVSAGPVVWTAFTTNDTTAAASAAVLTLAGRDFLTFKNIVFVGGIATPGCVNASATSTDIVFRDCLFLNNRTQRAISVAVGAGVAANWVIDRCLAVAIPANTVDGLILFDLARHSADYDINVLIENTTLIGAGNGAIRLISSGAGAGFGGGVDVRNCTILASIVAVQANDASLSSTYPCTVNNSFINANTCLNATTLGQITENYNILIGATPRGNVNTGANSQSTYNRAPLLSYGQEQVWGGFQRPLGEPMPSSPLLGFGNDGNQTAYDQRNKPRPAGSSTPAAGAYERGNTFITDTSPIGAGASAIKITGAGYAEYLIPVTAKSTVISCKVKWDATYAGTKPQLQIDANGKIGVTAETKTATGAAATIETVTLTAFTPTAAGNVTVRVISNDTNGAGVLQTDDFTVS